MLKERRQEPRVPADIAVTIWGLDAHGKAFSQSAVAMNFSQSGALLAEIEHELRCGDVIGVAYAGNRARFRVIWTRRLDSNHQTKVAVHRLSSDACPWKAVLSPGSGCLSPNPH